AYARPVEHRVVGTIRRRESSAPVPAGRLQDHAQVAVAAELELLAADHAPRRRLELAAEVRVARVDGARIAVVADQRRAAVADARLAVLGAVADVAVVALGVRGARSCGQRTRGEQRDEGNQAR